MSFAKISETRRTPVRITATFGVLIAALAAFVPLEEIAKLVNIGTLFAFVITNIGVIVLRRTRPDLKRGFRVPFVPCSPSSVPLLAIFLMKYLEAATWIRFGAWLLLGVVIYFAYGRRHSLLRRGQVRQPGGESWGTRRPRSRRARAAAAAPARTAGAAGGRRSPPAAPGRPPRRTARSRSARS